MTAKECTKKRFYNEVLIELDSGEFLDIQKAMIEFAQYHTEKALNAVYEAGISEISYWSGSPFKGGGSDVLDLDKILNVYPLNKIK
jgi:hypothetical protein